MNIFAKNAPIAEKNTKPNSHNPLRTPKEKLNGFESLNKFYHLTNLDIFKKMKKI